MLSNQAGLGIGIPKSARNQRYAHRVRYTLQREPSSDASRTSSFTRQAGQARSKLNTGLCVAETTRAAARTLGKCFQGRH